MTTGGRAAACPYQRRSSRRQGYPGLQHFTAIYKSVPAVDWLVISPSMPLRSFDEDCGLSLTSVKETGPAHPGRVSAGTTGEIRQRLHCPKAVPAGCATPTPSRRSYFCLSAPSTAAMRWGSAASGSMPARSTCNNWPTVLLRAPQLRFIASVNSS